MKCRTCNKPKRQKHFTLFNNVCDQCVEELSGLLSRLPSSTVSGRENIKLIAHCNSLIEEVKQEWNDIYNPANLLMTEWDNLIEQSKEQ